MIDIDTGLYIGIAMLGGVVALPGAPAVVKSVAGILLIGATAWKAKRSSGVGDQGAGDGVQPATATEGIRNKTG